MKAARWIGAMVGALALPFLTMGAYLEISRRNGHGSELNDYVGLGGSLVLGILCLWISPIATRPKALVSIAYAAGMAVALLLFAFGYVCGRFQSCL